MNLSVRAAFFALILIISRYASAALLAVLKIENPFLQVVFNYILAFGLPCIAYFTVTKNCIKTTLSLKPLNPVNVVFVLLISVCIQPAIYFLSALSSLLFPNEVSAYLNNYGNRSLIILLITLAVLPAVFEEICYRGIIFSDYGNVSIKKATLATGFIFAIAHLSAQQFLYAFLLGTVFCLMVYYTKSIFASMLSHVIINGIQVTLFKAVAVYSAQNPVAVSTEVAPSSAVLYLGAAFVISLPMLLFVFFSFIKYNTGKNKIVFSADESVLIHNPDPENEEKVISIPLILLTLFYIFMV